MKKILCIVCCCLLSLPALAAEKWKMGPSEACFVHTNSKGTGKHEFWYCGSQDTGCAGKKDGKNDIPHWQGRGDKVEAGDGFGLFWCCDNKYIKAEGDYEKEFEKPTHVTKDVEGGTCTYNKIIDACGNVVEDKPCTVATTCKNGYIERNGVCLKSCPDGYVFESKESNECIKCNTTAFSGVSFDGTNGNTSYCIKCDKDTQLYDKVINDCVDKKNLVRYSSEKMEDCFMCKNNENFKNCLAGNNVEKGCPQGYNPASVIDKSSEWQPFGMNTNTIQNFREPQLKH